MHVIRVLPRLSRTLAALALLSCTESVRSPASTPSLSSVSAPSAASGQDPLVLIASSDSPCEGGNRIDIAARVEADEEALVGVFGNDARFTLATKLAPLGPETKIRERGLVFIYSGHGVAVREGERETTHLCLANAERLSTDTLFEWIRDQRPLWATVILNGCETAQVNPAVVSSPPISVISASPSVVTPSSLPNVAGTDFIRVLIALIAPAQDPKAALVDTNCDGAISDRELFYSLEARLRRLAWERGDTVTALPVPKLRRNASVPLPAFYPGTTGKIEPATNPSSERRQCAPLDQAITRVTPELAMTIEGERSAIAARSLPMAPANYFVLNGVENHSACLHGTAKGVIATACTELKAALQPVQLSGDQIGDSDLREAAKALAVRSSASEIYWLKVDDGWAELLRLRDDAIVSIAGTASMAELVPSDPHRVLIGRAAGDTWSYAGKVSNAELAANRALPAVCRAPEGQCFRFPPSPTVAVTSEAQR